MVITQNGEKEGNAEEYLKQGISHYKNGDIDKAIECINNMILYDPNSSITYNACAGYYTGKGNYKFVIENSNKTINLNPKSASAYFGRGLVYYEMGKYGKAIKDFKTVLKMLPNNIYAKQYMEKAQKKRGW